MFDVILYGILLGGGLALLIGPVFFELIETSITKGIRSAVSLDVGILLSDLLLILVAYYFSTWTLGLLGNQRVIGISAGIIFLVFGLVKWFKKSGNPMKLRSAKSGSYLTLFTKGFILNTVNPSSFLFWVATMAYVIHDFDKKYHLLIYIIALSTVFVTDVLKIYTAKKLRSMLTIRRMYYLMQFSSLILGFFGLFLLFKYIFLN